MEWSVRSAFMRGMGGKSSMSRRLHLAQADGVEMEASTGVSMGLARLVEAAVRRFGPNHEAQCSNTTFAVVLRQVSVPR